MVVFEVIPRAKDRGLKDICFPNFHVTSALVGHRENRRMVPAVFVFDLLYLHTMGKYIFIGGATLKVSAPDSPPPSAGVKIVTEKSPPSVNRKNGQQPPAPGYLKAPSWGETVHPSAPPNHKHKSRFR